MAGGLEIEVKLKVGELVDAPERLTATKVRLEEMGATVTHPREFEDNLAFDFPDRSIVRSGSLLRVRVMARGTLLTFKGPVAPQAGLMSGGDAPPTKSAPMKARHETELMIPSNETDALLAIIRGLGMQPVFQYQKYRTTWDWKGLHILVDETPIGLYLELEGERALIEAGARELGYRSDDFITRSYRDLYLERLDQGDEGSKGTRSADRMVF